MGLSMSARSVGNKSSYSKVGGYFEHCFKNKTKGDTPSSTLNPVDWLQVGFLARMKINNRRLDYVFNLDETTLVIMP